MSRVTTPYANEVIAGLIQDQLTTALDMNQFITADYSLTEAAGMIKRINKYTFTGQIDEVSEGSGNTHSIAAGYESVPYTVKMYQGKFPYTDEQAMTDPVFVETGVKGLATAMTNDLTSKIVSELGNASLITYSNTWTFANFVDAIAQYPYEDESGLFFICNPAQLAAIRKNLGTNLSYSEAFVRTGYIGSICGVPLYVSKAVSAGTVFLADRKAVTAFVKKGVETEQHRDADTRTTSLFARQCMLIALTDATRVVKMVATAQG